MKKVRITVNKGSLGKKFPIFNSPESLYVWLNDPELQAAPRMDSSLGSIIFLRPGETMEVEWMGCEFINDGGNIFRVDHVRLAKTMKVKSLALSNVVGIHSGWITSDIISFKSGSDQLTKRTRLTDKSKHKFDINEIFESRGLSEKDEKDDYKVESQDLH